jgi:hypothetical protein
LAGDDFATVYWRVFKELDQRDNGTCHTAKGFWCRLDEIVTVEDVVGRDAVLRECSDELGDVAGVLETILAVVDASYGSRAVLVHQSGGRNIQNHTGLSNYSKTYWQRITPSRRASQKSFLSLSSPAELSTLEPLPATATWLELAPAPPLFPQTRSSLTKGCKRTSTSAHSFCASMRARCGGAFRNSLHRSEVAARITSRCSGVDGEIREAVDKLNCRFWVYAGVR